MHTHTEHKNNYTHIHTEMHSRMHTLTYSHIHSTHIYTTHIDIHSLTHTFPHIHTLINMHKDSTHTFTHTHTHTHTHTYIYIYIYIYISSSSCRAVCADIPDRLSPFLPITHRLRQVFRIYNPCPHIAAVCRFVLVVPHLHIHEWGSTGVHRL